ncbi:MAG: Gfo/Idh/MocA family protein [Hyphomicrobiales bacterium]
MAKFYEYPNHASVLAAHPQFDWIAVVDPDAEARERAGRDWNVGVTVPAVESLPDPQSYDIAVVATKPDVRLEALKALPSLRGALIEKPVGETLEQARAIISLCRERNIITAVNLFRRAEKTCRRLAASGFAELVGRVQFASVLYGRGLRNNAVHMVDLVRMLGEEIVAVRALGPVRQTSSPIPGDGEVSAALDLRGGGTACLHPLDFGCYRDVLVDFWGTRGRLEIFQEGLYLRHSPCRPHRAMEDMSEVALDEARVEATSCGRAYFDMYTNLADAVNGTGQLHSPLDEALRSEAVIEAILDSARNGGSRISLSGPGPSAL